MNCAWMSNYRRCKPSKIKIMPWYVTTDVISFPRDCKENVKSLTERHEAKDVALKSLCNGGTNMMINRFVVKLQTLDHILYIGKYHRLEAREYRSLGCRRKVLHLKLVVCLRRTGGLVWCKRYGRKLLIYLVLHDRVHHDIRNKKSMGTQTFKCFDKDSPIRGDVEGKFWNISNNRFHAKQSICASPWLNVKRQRFMISWRKNHWIS